jgi:hypothetical protein
MAFPPSTTMASREHEVQQRAILAMAGEHTRMYRNNVGTGWQGRGLLDRKIRPVTEQTLSASRAALRPGDIVIRAPRPLRAGLCLGSSDSIGLSSRLILPEHVGRRVAVFSAVEFKAATGPTPDQVNFIQTVCSLGGLAGLARSVEEAQAIVSGPFGAHG